MFVCQVAPAVGRADLLCALFMLSAFLVYCQALQHSNVMLSTALSLLTVILAALAMFSKEQGITILVSQVMVLAETNKFSLSWITWGSKGMRERADR